MKKILIILFSLFSLVLTAQESYYLVEVNGDIGTAGCGTQRGLREIILFYTDGSQDFLFDGPYFHNDTFNYSLEIRNNKKIQSLYVHAKRQTKNIAGCNNDDHSREYESINSRTCYYLRNNSAYGVTGGWYDFRITPIIILEEPSIENAFISSEDEINIGLPSSVIDLTHFNWQYKVANGPWINLPAQFQNDNYISIKGDDFLNSNDYGKDISFQVLTGCNGGSSNAIVYKALKSAPKLSSITNSTDVTCNNGSDGSITVEFNRGLNPGENVSFSVSDITDPDNFLPITISSDYNNVTAFDADNKLTIGGLSASPTLFRLKIRGDDGNGNALFSDQDSHFIDFEVKEPDYVTFSITDSTKVNCKGGEDGTITIEADGGSETGYRYSILKDDGTDGPWISFTAGKTHTIENLKAKTYSIKVMDSKGCIAKVIGLDMDGNNVPIETQDLTLDQLIEEPANILALEFLPVTVDRLNNSNDATANGFTDGHITAIVTGGTAPYNVVWTNKNTGVEVTTVSSTPFDDVEESQTFTLNNIGEGTYTLTVTDANHTQATQKTTCYAEGEFSIEDPDELLLTIEETNPVSCNSLNEFNNPVGDGQLVAHGTGGIKLDAFTNSGLPYYYTWKKEDENGVFQVLTEEKDSIISNLTAARYAVNIRDANGIVIGNYVNNSLVNETDVIHDLLDPEPFVITFTKGDLLCSDGTEGWAEATITGGTGSYTLNWSNGSTEPRIENLEKGTYLLFVTDEKGCQATSQVIIDAPNPLQVAILEENDPVCNNGSDGVISLGISGGLEDYTYNWLKDGNVIPSQTGFYANNLTAGTYTITVSDANLCSETVEITLENPSPDLISLGEDRLLCGGQSVVLDATYQGSGTTYLWTSDNGFTSTEPSIEVTEAGTYTVEVTTLLGCNGGDSIVITVSDTPIDAHFIVSTQAFAGEELALVNISEPIGDKVEWFLPEEAVVIAKTDENVILLFDEPGSYDILLRSNQGTCFLDYMKTIIIGEAENIPDIGDAETPFIQEFKIYPNPSSGQFYVDILLSEASPISLKIFSMASQGLVNERKEKAAVNFNLEYGTTLASGAYVLLLETAKGSEIRKIIIN